MAKLSRYHRIHKFDNGATLIYFKHNITDTTKFIVGFLGGAKQDKIPGTAHFLEHMLCQETPTLNSYYISKRLANMDVKSNAFTSQEYIMMYADSPNRNLNELCEIYSELLFNKSFNEKTIELERGAINEEINIALDQNSGASGVQTIDKYIKEKNIKHSILGGKKDIAKINESVLVDYIDNNFVSENLVVCVSSNLEFEQIKEIFEKYFVSKCKSDKTKRVRYEKTKYHPDSNYFITNINRNQKSVTLDVFYKIKKKEADVGKYAYVEDYILNGFEGRLLKELRSKQGLVYSSHFENVILPRDHSLKCFSIVTSPQKINEAILTLGDIITDISTNGITQQELDECKAKIAIREEDRKTNIKKKDIFGMLSRYLEGTEVFFNNPIHKVKDITLDEVNNYLKECYAEKTVSVYINGNIDANKLLTPAEIQQLFNSKSFMVMYDMLKDQFIDPETFKVCVDKDVNNMFEGYTKDEVFANTANFDIIDVETEQKLLLQSLTYDQKIKVLEDTAKQLGLNIKFQSNSSSKTNKVPDKNTSIQKTTKTKSKLNNNKQYQEELER